MLVKPEGCKGCPLETKGKGFCKDKPARGKARYLFIGEVPDKTEINTGEPFSGKSGFVLKNWLMRAVGQMQLAEEKGEIMYANTLRCLPPEYQGKPYPKGEERHLAEQHCRRYDAPLDGVETIVLFGEAPQRLWFAQELAEEDAGQKRLGRDVPGVMGRVGREYQKDGKRWVLTQHPGHLLSQPALVQHGQNSLKIVANTEKLLEPDYISWKDALGELDVQTQLS